MMAGQFEGQWYRAIIDEVNLQCQDVTIFFVDYGNRAVNLVHDVRLLSKELATLPAQAVHCQVTNCQVREMAKIGGEWIKMQVDIEEPGGVGRLAGPEFTLIVSL